MSDFKRLLPVTFGLLVSIACSGQPAAPPQEAAAPPASAPQYSPTATVRELMIHIIDPAGDMVWDAASTVIDDKGVNDIVPRTDDEWNTVRRGAVLLMEASNSLQIPNRPMSRPGEKSVVPGIELEPAAIQAMRDDDPAVWNNFATALHNAAVGVRTASDAKDASKLVELGEAIDHACENCHKHYWYPNEVIPDFPSGGKAETNPSVKK